MELDKRIKEGKRPLNCFDTEQAKQFIGKKCYFSDDARDFMNLDKADGDTLFYVAELQNIWTAEEYCFADNSNDYRFILPLEWAKPEESEEPEKKYRPYKNVQELFEDIGVYIGDTIHFRSKAKETESYSLITSYTTLKDGTEKICLGGAFYYTMQALFDLFELRSRGEWIPFGIEE